MKPLTDYLNWPVTEDIELVLTNLSSRKKLELSIALGQMALDERQGKEAWSRVQVNSIDSSNTLPIDLPTPEPIEGMEFQT